MKNFGVLVIFLWGLFSFSSAPPAVKRIRLSIDESSSLYLKGASNVNTFQCNCTESFPEYDIGFYTMGDSRRIHLSETQIEIPTKKLDCRNKAINKDLFKALQADDFPFITVDIREAFQMDECFLFESCDRWITLNVDASINIADVCQQVTLNVQAVKLGEDRYRLITAHTLSMCDFNIDPPRALMGLVKVDPIIEIHFDLIVEVISTLE